MSIFTSFIDIPSNIKAIIPQNQTEFLINGKIQHWKGKMQEVLSPVCVTDGGITKQICIGQYPMMSERESIEALDAAVAAYNHGFGEWPSMSVANRIKHIERFTFLMKEKKQDIVNLIMLEIGKPFTQAENEFDRTVEYINDTIQELKNLDRISSRFEVKQGVIGQIRRAPLGVVLCMGPFNYPLNETFTTLIPALIMGNTTIFKPPKYGVLLHRPLLEAFRDAFPKGVVNTIYGDGKEIVSPIMTSGKVDVLAFIGSSFVADILKKQHPKPHRLRCVLGLEAKNAAIILPDADMSLSVKECIAGSLSYNGQRCTAIKIILVHSSISTKFVQEFSTAVSELNLGLPWTTGVNITPLPELNKTGQMKELITDAENFGAKVVNSNGGEVTETIMKPAVLYPVSDKMKIYHVEQFGPVVPIMEYTDLEEVFEYVTNSNYGQQISIFGRNSDNIAQLIDRLVHLVCRVNINAQCQRGPDTFPFTGRKDSAEGTLSVSDALRVFSIRSLVAIKESDYNKEIITEILKEDKSNFLSTDFIF
jgi:glyceraldehyde-3-phosphate dehydrogenase (NADP+)